jgi:hypothetical protein
VVLDETDQSLLLGHVNELLVILDLLCSGFGNENMVTLVQGFRSDREMSRVRGKDDDSGSLGKSLQGGFV